MYTKKFKKFDKCIEISRDIQQLIPRSFSRIMKVFDVAFFWFYVVLHIYDAKWGKGKLNDVRLRIRQIREALKMSPDRPQILPAAVDVSAPQIQRFGSS